MWDLCRLVTRMVSSLLLIALIATNQTMLVSGSTSLSAHVEFSVLDFDAYKITWSLKVVIDGLLKSPVLAVQVGKGTVYRYDARYDRYLGITTIEESLNSNFTELYGRFPNEVRNLKLYFAINASVQNPGVGEVLKLPTNNYVGSFAVISIRGMASEAVADANPELKRYGEVYVLFAQIERSKGVAQYLTFAMVNFSIILDAIWLILLLVMVVQIGAWYKTRRRRWPCRNLLNTNYFAIVVGIVLFLPIYTLSLVPLVEPLPIMAADDRLVQLIVKFATLMIVSFVVSLITQRDP